MKDLLFNPFRRIAGWEALVAGLAIMLLAAALAAFTGYHLDGVIDLHRASPKLNPEVPEPTFGIVITESLIALLSMVLFTWIAGLILSGSSIRLIDILGTQALARAPIVLLTPLGFLPFDEKLLAFVESRLSANAERPEITAIDIAGFALMTLVMILALVWTVILMYKAYAVSCNVKGPRAVVSFIICIVLAEVLSKLLIDLIIL